MAGSESGAGSGSSYSQVISDGQQTVSLAAALVNLAGRPLANLWNKRRSASEYRAKLGEWAGEAVDGRGQWLQPVLRAAAFEDHLVRENGRFVPTGKCESPFAWAQLLYALNIRPKAGVLAWRLPPKAVDPSKPGGIALVVDGSVMCHIINLYRQYQDPAPADFSPNSKQSRPDPDKDPKTGACRFPFGQLSVQRLSADHFAARFEPGSQIDLAKERVPFSRDWDLVGGSRLYFEQDTLIAKYFNCVHNQLPATDTASIGPPPPPNAALGTRADYYNRSIDMLRSMHECTDVCERLCERRLSWHYCGDGCVRRCRKEGEADWQRPRLVTGSWLTKIERIKRRVTTNGGDDDDLLVYIMGALQQRPQFLEAVSKIYGEPCSNCWPGSKAEKAVHNIIRKRFMFAQDRILMYWPMPIGSGSNPYGHDQLTPIIERELPAVLAELDSQRQGGWLAQLAGIMPAVQLMLESTDRFCNVPVVVLELGPDHELWSSVWEVNAE